MLDNAMSSSSIGACPHHSDRRWPRISASSARRRVYSTSGVSCTEMDATTMTSYPACTKGIVVIARSTCDEAIQFWLRRAMDCFAYARNDGREHHPSARGANSHMSNFLWPLVERRMPVDLGLRGLEHHALLIRIGGRDRARRHHPDR